MSEEITNRVAQSGIITLDLGEYFPKDSIKSIDLKDWLFMGLVLKEKDFREAITLHDWKQYMNTNVLVFCSADAVIQVWAYMLIASHLQPYAKQVFYGNKEQFLASYYHDKIKELNPADYENQRVVIKGCGDFPVPASAYAEITSLLLPYVKSVMYGEPCSTVPVYKKQIKST